MLRLSILQSVNGTVLKLNINENRFLTKCMNNLKTSNGIVETKDTSKLQDTRDSDIDGDVHKQTKNMKVMLQEQQRNYKEQKNLSETKKLKSVNEFKVMVNIKSVSIFGSETVENCGIQYIEDNEDLKIPTVTHILSETMSPKVKAALERWKKNTIDIYGEECFKSYCKGALKSGKLFHSFIQMLFSNKEIEIPPSIEPIYLSIKPILNDMKIFHRTQTNVIHPTLGYKSIIDCIASFRGETYLINWKKSERRETSLATIYDTPIQVAAYIGAINAFNTYSFKIDKGLVIVAYTNGEPASIYELKDDALQIAWREWLSKLEQFHANYYKGSLNT